MKSIVQKLINYFNSWYFGFQIFLIVISINIIMFSLFLVPMGDSTLSQFAADFKVWCFGYDPESNQSQKIIIFGFLTESIVVASFAFIFWKEKILIAIKTQLTKVIFHGVLIFGLVLGTSYGYYQNYISKMVDAVPIFPSRALRTSFKGPEFKLVNHRNEKIDQSTFKGKVLIITAFYAHCTSMCPTILNQLKIIYDQIKPHEHKNINLLAITLDPEKDDVETLNDMSDGYGLDKDNVHFATGEPKVVNKLLDQLSFSRMKNEATGEIDHPGLYLLLDNNYKIAYRFSTGKLQERWMLEAIQILTNEIKLAKVSP